MNAMRALRADRRIPLTVEGIVQGRVNSLGTYPEVVDGWWGMAYSTCDGAIFHPKGEVKLVRDSELLKLCTSKPSQNGLEYIEVDFDAYDRIEGSTIDTPRPPEPGLAVQPVSTKVEEAIWEFFVQDAAMRKTHFDYARKHTNSKSRFKVLLGYRTGYNISEEKIAIWPIVIEALPRFPSDHGQSGLQDTYLSHILHDLVGFAPDLKGHESDRLFVREFQAEMLEELASGAKNVDHQGRVWTPLPQSIADSLENNRAFMHNGRMWTSTDSEN